MQQKFIYYGRLPSINDYTNACRRNPYVGAKMKKNAEREIMDAIIAGSVHSTSHTVELLYTFYEKDTRRDLDNISGFAHKVIQDALVNTGIIPGDGWKDIKAMRDMFRIDKKCPRIEVIIIEV